MGKPNMKMIALVFALPFLVACGKDDRSVSSVGASAGTIHGDWLLTQIRCAEEESQVPLFTDNALTAGVSVSSTLRINHDLGGYRTWAIDSCVITTPMTFSSVTSSTFHGEDSVASCAGDCTAFAGLCGQLSPIPTADYSYVIEGSSMTVNMPVAATVAFCGASQSSSLVFVYHRK